MFQHQFPHHFKIKAPVPQELLVQVLQRQYVRSWGAGQFLENHGNTTGFETVMPQFWYGHIGEDQATA